MVNLVKIVVGIAIIVAVIKFWYYLLMFVAGVFALFIGLVVFCYILMFSLDRLGALSMIFYRKMYK